MDRKNIESAIGYKKYRDEILEFYDLPGTYSLIPRSEEEKVTSDFLISNKYDVVLVVCDALSLRKNLKLVIQTLEITKKVIVCINLLDEAKKENVIIDIEKLSTLIETKVVGISARKKEGIDTLLESILHFDNSTYNTNYIEKIEESIKVVNEYTNSKFEAIKMIIENDCDDLVIREKINQINKYLKESDINFTDEIMKKLTNDSENVFVKVVYSKYKI